MLKIEMKNENTNTTTNAVKTERTYKNSKKKLSGFLTYMRSSLLGVFMAMCSFTAALAIQPKISDSTLNNTPQEMVSEATTADLTILSEYMDNDILDKINQRGKEPSEVLIEYLRFDESFEDTLIDYFN